MHTYIGGPDIYIVGFLMVQKTNGTESFVPLFEVGTRTDAWVAVSVLNGGGPVQAITVLKEYTEGVSPSIPRVPEGIPGPEVIPT